MLKHKKAFSSFSSDSLSKAKEFYGNMLGLKVSESDEGLELEIGSGNLVFIYPKSNHTPATHTVLNFIVDDVDKTVDYLNSIGIQLEQFEGFKTDEKGIFYSKEGPPKIGWFRDPAGNILSILQEK